MLLIFTASEDNRHSVLCLKKPGACLPSQSEDFFPLQIVQMIIFHCAEIIRLDE